MNFVGHRLLDIDHEQVRDTQTDHSKRITITTAIFVGGKKQTIAIEADVEWCYVSWCYITACSLQTC